MNLEAKQQKLYEDFYNSTIGDGILDEKTEHLVGLSAAMAIGCEPCTAFYVKRCQKVGITTEEIQAVLAKVMAVAAGQKRLQTAKALRDAHITLGEVVRK